MNDLFNTLGEMEGEQGVKEFIKFISSEKTKEGLRQAAPNADKLHTIWAMDNGSSIKLPGTILKISNVLVL